jgi:hypothetical protein
MARTLDEIVQAMLGQQAMQVAQAQWQIEELQARLEKAQANEPLPFRTAVSTTEDRDDVQHAV